MAKYVAKRLVTGAAALLFLTFLTFVMAHKMPGNPFDTGNVSEQVLQTIEEEYGLGEPLQVQFAFYMKNLLRGDLGMSIKKPGVTVNSVIARSLPVTAKVGILAFLSSLILGTLLGIWHLMTKRKLVKKVILFIESVGISVPNFVYALLFMLIFGVYLKWFPIAGITTPMNYVLPVAALAVYPTCVISRMFYSAVQKEYTQEYVMFLKAKGLKESAILMRHMWRPALTQLLTYLGQLLVYLVTGCFVVESIFTIPGLGREFVMSINNRDYTVIMGLTVFAGAIVILAQLVLDVVQMYLDPRIRFGTEQNR
ncbi:ABC transporter permease [Bariatricus sp. SGI.019]|uniref:ABC transporter permease n=1 Tax=Bariatricus sp. SGI.019 TaxID=3420548 RepID=UPI003D08A906